MATFSNLVVKLTADTKKATKDIQDFTNKASKSAKMVGKDASTSMKKASDWTRRATMLNNEYVSSVARLRRAFHLAKFAAAGLFVGLGISKAIKDVDNLAKTSQKLGIPVEQLQSIQFAAGLAGVSIEKTNMGLQRMTRRVAEAAMGTGEAQNALRELGLDAQRLTKLSPDQQFREIAKAMQAVGTQSDRVRLGFKLFDSEGVALINAMNASLAASEARFRKLGIAINRTETSNIERLVDTFSTLGTIAGNAFKKLVAAAAPGLIKLGQTVVGIVEKFQLVPKAAQAAGTAFNYLGKVGSTALIGLAQSAKGIFLSINLIQSALNDLNFDKASEALKLREQQIARTKDLISQSVGDEQKRNQEALKDLIEGGTEFYKESLQDLKSNVKILKGNQELFDSRTRLISQELVQGRDEVVSVLKAQNTTLSNIQAKGLDQLSASSLKATESLTQFDAVVKSLAGTDINSSTIANKLIGDSNSADAQLARALLSDTFKNLETERSLIRSPLTFSNILDQGQLQGVKQFGGARFGDGKSPLDGIIRDGSSFTQPQKVDVNITVRTKDNFLEAITETATRKAAENDKE